MNPQASPAIVLISAMITPALLILGSGSLVATALQRLARAVDRARVLLLLSEEDARRQGWTPETWQRSLARYGERSRIGERAVTLFFVGVGLFVIDCLSIAIDRYFADALTWLPVSLTILGMLTMLGGVYCMVLESRLANQQIREEIQTATARPFPVSPSHASHG